MDHECPTPSNFLTNIEAGTVGKALRTAVDLHFDSRAPRSIDVATAYFNCAGWWELREILRSGGTVRLLLGTVPDSATDPLLSWGLPQEGQPASWENEWGFQPRAIQQLAALAEWLREERVQVRLYTKRFLHGKVFTFHAPYLVPSKERGGSLVAIGSANFTGAGMNRNLEAVTTTAAPSLVAATCDWFDNAWNEAQDIKSEAISIYEGVFDAASADEIFMAILERVLQDDPIDPPRGVLEDALWLSRLSDFQVDGARRAQAIMSRYGGVLIADDVGLGKTYTGGALVQRAVADGKKVLVVAPATIKPDWDEYLGSRGISRFVEVISYSRLQDPKGWKRHLQMHSEDIGLLVLDEAHWIRNETRRRSAVEEILAGGRAELLLLTATPINNSLMDLYSLISLFLQDEVFREAGVRSLRGQFEMADKFDALDPEVDWVWLGQILSQVMVRRTRQFIREKYTRPGKELTAPDGTPWRFPKLEAPKHVAYIPSPDYQRLATDVIESLLGHSASPIILAAYGADVRTDGKHAAPASGLIRSTLLKRLESSMVAFHATLASLRSLTAERLAEIQGARDRLQGADALPGRIEKTDIVLDDSEEDGGDLLPVWASGRSQYLQEILLSDESLARHEANLQHDLLLLEDWTIRSEILAEEENSGSKIISLAELIAAEQRQPGIYEAGIASDRRKFLVFASSAITANWLAASLPGALERVGAKQLRVGLVTGQSRPTDRKKNLDLFAPKTRVKEREDAISGGDELDVLIATDVLSEGVNLQQARNVVHFDIPWNPMRAVQRAGRIDRLGSAHETVQNYCFLPPGYVDECLHLIEKVREKSAKAAVGVGTSDQLNLQGVTSADDYRVDDSFLVDLTEHLSFARTLEDEKPEAFAPQVDVMDIESLRLQLREWLPRKPSATPRAAVVEANVSNPTWVFSYVLHGRHMVGAMKSGSRALQDASTWDVLQWLSGARPVANIGDLTGAFTDAATTWEAAASLVIDLWNQESEMERFETAPKPGKSLEEIRDLIGRSGAKAGLSEEQIIFLRGSLLAAEKRPATHEALKRIFSSDQSEASKIHSLFRLAVSYRLAPRQEPAPRPLATREDLQLLSWVFLVPSTHSDSIASDN